VFPVRYNCPWKPDGKWATITAVTLPGDDTQIRWHTSTVRLWKNTSLFSSGRITSQFVRSGIVLCTSGDRRIRGPARVRLNRRRRCRPLTVTCALPTPFPRPSRTHQTADPLAIIGCALRRASLQEPR